MRLLKDRFLEDVTTSEISNISFEPRKKLIAVGSFKEPVLMYRYPYMKLFKKIIHREKILYEEPINNTEEKIEQNEDGSNIIKGSILTATQLDFTKTGQYLLIGYENGDLLIYNTQTWEKKVEFDLKDKISSMQMVNAGKSVFITTASWNTYFINTTTWKIEKNKQFAVGTDGTLLITNDLKTLYLITDKKRVASIDYETGEEIHVFKGHKSGINQIALSPDEKILATCGNDNKLCLFDTSSGELLSYLLGHTDEVHSFVFSEKGDFLVSSSEDFSLRLWDTQTFKCVKIMQEIPNSFSMKRYEEIILTGNVDGGLCTFKFY